METAAAGAAAWGLPPLPVRSHGVGGLLHGRSFHAMAGSQLAGAIQNGGHLQVCRG